MEEGLFVYRPSFHRKGDKENKTIKEQRYWKSFYSFFDIMSNIFFIFLKNFIDIIKK